jgi:hypothetical protein
MTRHNQFRKECKSTTFTIVGNAAVTIQERGQKSWSICQPGMVMNKRGEWEYEPFPSQRSQDFISRTRWPSPEEAYEFYRRNIPARPFLVQEG